MARRSIKSTTSPADTDSATQVEEASATAKPSRIDTSALDIEALAEAILAGEIKPRVGEIRRLAEALVRKKQNKKAKKVDKADRKGSRKSGKARGRKDKK